MTTTIDGQTGAVIEHEESLAAGCECPDGVCVHGNCIRCKVCTQCDREATIPGARVVGKAVDPLAALVNAGCSLLAYWIISKIPAPSGAAEKQRKQFHRRQRRERRRKKRRINRLFLK